MLKKRIQFHLKELSEKKGVTLHAVSRETGITYRTIRMYAGLDRNVDESGQERSKGMREDVLIKLCDYFEVPLSDVISYR